MRYVQGAENSENLWSLIRSIHDNRYSGVLEVTQHNAHMNIYFRSGELYLRSQPLAERLAGCLNPPAGSNGPPAQDARAPQELRRLLRRIAEHISDWEPDSLRFIEGGNGLQSGLVGPVPTSLLLESHGVRDGRPWPPLATVEAVTEDTQPALSEEAHPLPEISVSQPPLPSEPASSVTTEIWRHFGLKGDPFSLTPDPSLLYLSPDHKEALAALQLGLIERRGLIVMVGEVGTGKTTLNYALLSGLDSRVESAYVSNTSLNFDEMMEAVLKDFGVIVRGRRRLDLLESLNEFLEAAAREDKTVVLVIDEAQTLSAESVEQLRLLLNFESYQNKLLQIILVGQPELAERLSSPHMRQIADRIAVRCHLNPLSHKEVLNYVQNRVEAMAGSSTLFTRRALKHVAKKSSGIPRRINILCHNAMLLAYGHNEHKVTSNMIAQIAREMSGEHLLTRPSVVRPSTDGWSAKLAHLKLALRSRLGLAAAIAIVSAFGLGSFLVPSNERGGATSDSVASKSQSPQVLPLRTEEPTALVESPVPEMGSSDGAEVLPVGWTTANVNLRTGPSRSFPVLRILRSNAEVAIADAVHRPGPDGREETWLQVAASEQTGWIHADFVSLIDDQNSQPTQQPPSEGAQNLGVTLPGETVRFPERSHDENVARKRGNIE